MITAQATINLDAIRHNYQQLKKLSDQQLIAVVKGNAYGHGAIAVAKALDNADAFAVARIEEAIELRAAKIEQPILLLEGCFCQDDLDKAAKYNLDVVIHSEYQLDDLEALNIDNSLSVWLKVDTGMHRIGIEPTLVPSYQKRLAALTHVDSAIGIISHFSCADERSNTATTEQITAFSQVIKDIQGPKSIANSAGLLMWPDSSFGVARAGIALYGISPIDGYTGHDFGLIPVMTFTSRLISIRQHKAGQPVGYGQTWRPEQDTTLGVIAAGYGDGYPRSASNCAKVFINGRQVPIVGRVSMDMLVVDLGQDARDCSGDQVELWGEQMPIEQVAQAAGTIPYELTIQLTSRVNLSWQQRGEQPCNPILSTDKQQAVAI
ncbi:alanine racemase [Vibrio sp. WXL210]|uniref:alanine racemase n=1 Tax=Vibrio sp. WXL210 TaxID=3450709 RepID=UPI003EC6A39E